MNSLAARMAAAWPHRERTIKPFAPALPTPPRESNLNFAARRCGIL